MGADGGGDNVMSGAGSVSGSDKDVNIVLERNGNQNHHNQHYDNHKHQGDMDYDVADENQWEMS